MKKFTKSCEMEKPAPRLGFGLFIFNIFFRPKMTRGECLGLRWEDIDFENRTISVNHSLVHRQFEEGGEWKVRTLEDRDGSELL